MTKAARRWKKSLKKADRYDRRYVRMVIKAIRYTDSPAQAAAIIEEYLGPAHQGGFFLVNPEAKKIWLECIAKAFTDATDREPRLQIRGFGDVNAGCPVAMLTITDAGWACSEFDIRFNLEKAIKKIRNALAGIPMLGAFEIAVYTNETFESGGREGRLVSFHAHVVVWASSLSSLKRRCRKIRKRFKGMLGRKHGAHIRKIENLDQASAALTYTSKFLVDGKRTRITGKGIRQSSARIPHAVRRRIFDYQTRYEISDLWFGSGIGADIYRAARNELSKIREARSQEQRMERRKRPRRLSQNFYGDYRLV